VICKHGNPTARQTSWLAHHLARELKAAGWRLERFLSDNGNEFKGDFTATVDALKGATPAFTQDDHRPTDMSRHCTRRSSMSAGAQHSRATFIPATPA
jgi:hypothetical protein